MVNAVRSVKIVRDTTEVVFGLSLADSGQIVGEGQPEVWRVSGRVRQGAKRKPMIVKLVGVVSSFSREAEIGESGRFALDCDGQGRYLLFVVSGQTIIFQKMLDLSLAGPDLIDVGEIVQ